MADGHCHQTDGVVVVVVTYNRKDELRRCIQALLTQTRAPDAIRVMDNGSSDGTGAMIATDFGQHPRVLYTNLNRNLGGAGGFHYGARLAAASGRLWAWLMDDDCLPAPNCLENLLAAATGTRDVYSPIILSIEDSQTTLWGINARPDTGDIEVTTLPFNGFLVHTDTIRDIGPPEKDFFIYGDDTEYNLRARRSGRRIIMATGSRLYHPHKNNWKSGQILALFTSRIWIYYKLRNAIVIYRRYGYYSKNQWLMFFGALGFALLTLRWGLAGLWLTALADGLQDRLYLKTL